MCTREQVEHIVEKSTVEVKDAVRDLRREHDTWQRDMATSFDKRISEVATAIFTKEKDSMVRFIGWGGIVTIGTAVWFFGGLTNQVDNMQLSLQEIKSQQAEVTNFMNRGDRFTTEDAGELKGYIDQQDEYILRRVDDGFASLAKQIDNLHSQK